MQNVNVQFTVIAWLTIITCASLTDVRRYGLKVSTTRQTGVLEESMIPLSIGVEVYGGHVEYCLSRGDFIPQDRTRILLARQFEFMDTSRVVAGERATWAADNVQLGKWAVPSREWGILAQHPRAGGKVPPLEAPPVTEAELVLLRCTVDDHAQLTVVAARANVTFFPTPTIAHWPSFHLTVFSGPLDRSSIAHEAVEQHVQGADRHLGTDNPRRNSMKARLSFEQLIAALWQQLGTNDVDDDGTAGDAHRDVMSDAVVAGLKILAETSGTHQDETIYSRLEEGLRQRIHFMEHEEDHEF